jgi:OTU domain-containing protein 6
MGKKKKSSGGAGSVETDGPSLASDDVLRGETLSAIELRHELELAEVKKTTAHMTGKKEQMDVLRIEGLVTDRQYLETRRWEELREDDEDEEGAKKEEAEKKDDVAPPVAAMKSVSLSSAGDDEDDGKKHETQAQAKGETSGMTKAMKRRVKKKNEERERDERVEFEKSQAGPSDGELESKRLRSVLSPLGLRVDEVKADGHCLYRAIADQLVKVVPEHAQSGCGYQELRTIAATAMRNEENAYRPFLENVETYSDWAAYLNEVETSAAWGGQLELQALAVSLKTTIQVYRYGRRGFPESRHLRLPIVQSNYVIHVARNTDTFRLRKQRRRARGDDGPRV